MLAETPPMPVSKVLVLDTDAACQATIAAFCAAQRLQPHKVRADNMLAVLRSNIDLGAIFLSDRIGDDAHAGRALGRHIHAVRPELPIFLRAETAADAQALPDDARRCFAAVYVRASIDELVPLVQQAIFSLVYRQRWSAASRISHDRRSKASSAALICRWTRRSSCATG